MTKAMLTKEIIRIETTYVKWAKADAENWAKGTEVWCRNHCKNHVEERYQQALIIEKACITD